MPNTYTSNQSIIQIPENVKRVVVSMVGAGGAGEYINRITGTPSPGASGTATTFLGLIAGGGQGGGIGGRNQGGAGGTASTPNYSYSGLTLSNGASGAVYTAGGNGGNGTTDSVSYNSTITHYFDDNSNYTYRSDTSPDIYFYPSGEGSSDVPCGDYWFSKHYKVRFNFPYDNTNYYLGITYICPQTAAGGYFSGYASNITKYTDGFDVWFCKYRVSGGGTVNSFVRCFNFTTSGSRSSLRGRGGGGGASITGTLTREDLSSRGLLGTQTSLSIGIGGLDNSTNNVAPLAFDGGAGSANIYIEYLARAEIYSDATDDTIVQGQSVRITWRAYGDIEWALVEPGIAPQGSNYTGSVVVTPTSTTTYFVRAYGSIGGTATAEVIITVLPPPELEINGPISIDYGSDVLLSYTARYAVTSLTIEPIFYFIDGSTTSGAPYNVSLPISEYEDDQYTYNMIPWGDKGPSYIEFKLRAVGYSYVANGQTQYLTNSVTFSVPVNIDITPDLISIPETDDAIKDQDPVYSPEEDSSITLRVTDIDISVVITCDYPIQVQIDDDGIWRDLEIT